MRVNKIFGVKSITNLIYGILLLLPMVSILSRVIYTQSNPNAKDSYSNERVQLNSKINDNDTILQGVTYTAVWNGKSDNYNVSNQAIQILPTGNNILEILFPNETWTPKQINFTYETNRQRIIVYDTNNRQHNCFNYFINNPNGYLYFIPSQDYVFTTISSNYVNYTYSVITTEKLDNVFEYSLDTFLQDYDNEGVDFFSWFTNLFLNQSNQHNALYLNFCNWYMNYVLLVSSAYLLFFALMWFINYIRKLLEKSSYQDFGGF